MAYLIYNFQTVTETVYELNRDKLEQACSGQQYHCAP